MRQPFTGPPWKNAAGVITQPTQTLKVRQRGSLAAGHCADVVVFDPARVQDHATFEKPHQYSTGMIHVLVNGVQVLRDGEHTGALPGRVVDGPGKRAVPLLLQ